MEEQHSCSQTYTGTFPNFHFCGPGISIHSFLRNVASGFKQLCLTEFTYEVAYVNVVGFGQHLHCIDNLIIKCIFFQCCHVVS